MYLLTVVFSYMVIKLLYNFYQDLLLLERFLETILSYESYDCYPIFLL